MEFLCQRMQRCSHLAYQLHNRMRISWFHSQKSPPVTIPDLALVYFDSSYSSTYGRLWPSIRLGLLCQHKYVAIVNNYAPGFTGHVQKFVELGAFDVGDLYRSNCRKIMEKRTKNKRKRKTKTAAGNRAAAGDAAEAVDLGQNHRKRQSEMTDDELVDTYNEKPTGRYPAQYRHNHDNQNSREISLVKPCEDRMVMPQQHLSAEAQAQALHDFVPADSLKGLDDYEEEGDVFIKNKIMTQPGEGPGVTMYEKDEFLPWPELLTVMAFHESDVTPFPKPSFDCELYDHFALNGSSLLPVLLLGLRPGDKVLDMCAAPGGKTLTILQTHYTDFLQSNDTSPHRIMRIKSVIKQFFSNDSPVASRHLISISDGRTLHESNEGGFDRVLVDVPCLTDRQALKNTDQDNIFSRGNRRDRLSMPELQAQLLVAALHSVRVGGTVVYSTCTLSPLQNDGVVHLALNRIWEDTGMSCTVVNYQKALEPFEFMFTFGKNLNLKYGQIILPWVPNNYGPMYCAKIVRTK